MKKLFVFTLVYLLLGTVSAYAANYVSITELQESLPERWTQTYETKWRTIEIDVEPIVPSVENFPILMVTPSYNMPDFSLLGEGWVSEWYEGDGFLGFNASLSGVSMAEGINAEKLKDAVTITTVHFPPYDFNKVYAENSDVTIGEAIEELKSLLAVVGENIEEWWHERPEEISCNITVNRKSGEHLALSPYYFTFNQKLNGVPLFRENMDWRQEMGYGGAGLSFTMWDSGSVEIGGNKVDIVDTISDDVPLLSFQTIQTAIEKEIKEGRIRKIFDIELGYALYYEPGSRRGKNHPREVEYYAVPVWCIKCFYVDKATNELREYNGSDVPMRASADYRKIFFNAQTGKIIDAMKKGTGAFNGFVSWEKVGGKK